MWEPCPQGEQTIYHKAFPEHLYLGHGRDALCLAQKSVLLLITIIVGAEVAPFLSSGLTLTKLTATDHSYTRTPEGSASICGWSCTPAWLTRTPSVGNPTGRNLLWVCEGRRGWLGDSSVHLRQSLKAHVLPCPWKTRMFYMYSACKHTPETKYNVN